jgi:hypothetical protein
VGSNGRRRDDRRKTTDNKPIRDKTGLFNVRFTILIGSLPSIERESPAEEKRGI